MQLVRKDCKSILASPKPLPKRQCSVLTQILCSAGIQPDKDKQEYRK